MGKHIIFIISVGILCIPIYLHHRKRNEQNESIPATTTDNNLDAVKLKDCLDMNNMWIANCDQKASILLAVMGVVFTIVMTSDAIKTIRYYIILPFLDYYNGNEPMCFSFSRFACFFFMLTTSGVAVLALWNLLYSIKPNLDYVSMLKGNPSMAKKSYLFYGSVANMSYEEFKSAQFDYLNDLRSQVYINAKIASMKFKNYLEGFFWFKMMILSAIFLSISVMFMQ